MPSPADLPNPGVELEFPALQADSLPTANRETSIWYICYSWYTLYMVYILYVLYIYNRKKEIRISIIIKK